MANVRSQPWRDEHLGEEETSAGASDADSDLEELEGDIARFDESVRQFLATHNGGTEPIAVPSAQPSTRGAPRGRGARGPRKAAKPRGDITARLAKVNQAFLAGDYATALTLASEVIRINAETHQAWTSLASIFAEIGEITKSLSAMVYAAHLRPKDVPGWLRCASFALDNIEEDVEGNLHTARLCYSAALRADSSNLDARIGKATVCHRQGHLGAAIMDYKVVLKHRPHDLDLVRKLAEACLDNKHIESSVPAAIASYRRYFDLEIGSVLTQADEPPWHDIGIYVELFASVGRYDEAISELKSLARWAVGRSSESYWDQWQGDDREWDEGNDRRLGVPEFTSSPGNHMLYGVSLPRDLRARLAIYRLGIGQDSEAFKHLNWLDPTEHHTRDFVGEFPFLAFDVASELYRHAHFSLAAKFLEVLREVSGEPDATVLLELGRCYLATGGNAAAEECFLTAIEVDEESIDARIELANMYEKAKEDEEALILAAEAMALQEAHDQPLTGTRQSELASHRRRSQGGAGSRVRRHKVGGLSGRATKRPVIPRRYRPKRLANPDKRRQEEQAHAIRLSRQYSAVCELKNQIRSGRDDLVDSWMRSSRELIDDFRSLKKFYSWDKYLNFLSSSKSPQPLTRYQPSSELSQMYERLTRTLAPQPDLSTKDTLPNFENNGHQGISFDEWLNLFLDYAVGLAAAHRREESYSVCEAAKDSTVFQSPNHNFAIYVAWSVCAIYTSDEEKCISIARHLMKDGAISDSHRMFALLSTLCQSPISWYTSGPAQKFILRQIKAIDSAHLGGTGAQNGNESVNVADPVDVNLDVCLLMLYGHILFTSTSYTFALGYFLRARALDPENLMVNLSLGLAYVHYGLKRQSANRQYLILQGQAFIDQYVDAQRRRANGQHQAEVFYNIGRLFHLLGIASVAMDYYEQASRAAALHSDRSSAEDIRSISRINQVISLLSVGNNKLALGLLKKEILI
ncbi:unnamed protein product [Clonostachys chloroleuca]|uniref:Transcription factor tau subunit sfc4 n=1 Tax=Clonostachys chloroleuca TaxID=1926264 RepID=A0AA35MJ86_9HYPO|nr:unnamed protein product [Clonostachys chloroleuca]